MLILDITFISFPTYKIAKKQTSLYLLKILNCKFDGFIKQKIML